MSQSFRRTDGQTGNSYTAATLLIKSKLSISIPWHMDIKRLIYIIHTRTYLIDMYEKLI